MKFRTREVKKRKNFKPREVKREVPKNRPFPRLFVVFMKCEIFEISDLNKIDMKCPMPASKREYSQNNRVREFHYVVNDENELTAVMKFWKKSIVELAEEKNNNNLINKLKFTLRAIREEKK